MKKKSCLLTGLLLAFLLSGCKSTDYEKAMELYVHGDYEAACVIFAELGNYEDSTEMVNKCTYELAVEHLIDKKYAEAAELFCQLGDYKDSEDRTRESRYHHALALVEENQMDAALEIFVELGDYRDAADYAQGMKWIAFTEYIAEQGTVVVEGTNTIELSMSGDRIYVEMVKDGISFSGNVLIDRENPVTELNGTITIGYGNDLVDVNGTALWDISRYKSGDSIEWKEIAYGNISRLPSNTRSVLRQLTAEYFLGSGDAATILERLTAGIGQALTDSGLNVTMADLGFTSY